MNWPAFISIALRWRTHHSGFLVCSIQSIYEPFWRVSASIKSEHFQTEALMGGIFEPWLHCELNNLDLAKAFRNEEKSHLRPRPAERPCGYEPVHGGSAESGRTAGAWAAAEPGGRTRSE